MGRVEDESSSILVKGLHYVELDELVRKGEFFGGLGKLEFSPDGERVQCHLCGKYFKLISHTHLRFHGLENSSAYRDLFGLRHNQPLCSPVLSQKESDHSIAVGSAKYFEGKGNIFTVGYDSRRSGRRVSRQEKSEKQERKLRRREENIIPLGWKQENGRLVSDGRFYLYGQTYFFSKRVGEVEIIGLDDENVTVRGLLSGGLELVKIYKRKDR